MQRHRHRSTRYGAWTIAALAALMFAPGARAQTPCKITAVLELPITMKGTRAMTQVTIAGTSVPLMVDSGAFFSMLTDAAAAQLKLKLYGLPRGLRISGITGDVDMQRTMVDKLHLLGGDLPDMEFLVGGNEPGSGAMGLLGRNLLTFTDLEFDLPHGVIRLVFPNDECGDTNMAYWAGNRPVSELVLVRAPREAGKWPELRARVKINGESVVALLDTGAQTLVTRNAALRAGVAEAAMVRHGEIGGVGLQRVKAWTAPFDTVELGGEAIRNNRLLVADLPPEHGDEEMILGIDFFLSHRIYITKRHPTMFFTYEGGPVFSLNKGAETKAIAFDDQAASGATAVTADQFARRGAAALARRDYADALSDLDRACALDPGSAAYLTQRGVIHESMKDRDKALHDFDQALALDPAQAEARGHRAAWRLVAHDRDGALQDLAVLDTTLPAQATERLTMARMYAQLDQREQVIAQLDDWIAVHPNDSELPGARNLRCWTRVQLNRDLDKALADCDEAVDAQEKNASFLDSRGWVYLRQQKFRQAARDFDRSLELRSASATTLYGRAVARMQLGDPQAADADLAAARKAAPGIDKTLQRLGLALLPAPTQ